MYGKSIFYAFLTILVECVILNRFRLGIPNLFWTLVNLEPNYLDTFTFINDIFKISI